MRGATTACSRLSRFRIVLPLLTAILIVSPVLSSEVRSDDTSDGAASTPAEAKPSPAKPTVSAPPAPVYVPPRRGQPRGRVGGGTRGPAVKLPTLQALVPDHVALTAQSQPKLLWHLDRLPPDRASIVFALTNEEEIDPLVAEVLDRPVAAGVQQIDLTRFEYHLEAGREYQWSVALVTDFERRSRDIITFGWIERVEPSAISQGPESDTASRAASDDGVDPDVTALAAAGLWYDAVAAADGSERAALLDQVGLDSSGLR